MNFSLPAFACKALATGLLTFAFTSALSAQQSPEGDSALRRNCVGDYFRFCSSYAPGSDEIRQCFITNTPRLTPECRGAIRAFDRRNGNPHS